MIGNVGASPARRARRADRGAVVVHVAQQPAHVAGHEVGLQRPGRVRVADGEGEVGDPAEHHSLVGTVSPSSTDSPSTVSSSPPSISMLKAGGVTITSATIVSPPQQAHAVRGEAIDLRRHDARAAVAQHFEEVAVGGQAHALVPRVVGRREVRLDVVAGGQLLAWRAA